VPEAVIFALALTVALVVRFAIAGLISPAAVTVLANASRLAESSLTRIAVAAMEAAEEIVEVASRVIAACKFKEMIVLSVTLVLTISPASVTIVTAPDNAALADLVTVPSTVSETANVVDRFAFADCILPAAISAVAEVFNSTTSPLITFALAVCVALALVMIKLSMTAPP
jgi:hypothetical protein